MKTSTNLRLKLPEGKDPVNISDLTENFETLDTYLEKMQTRGSDVSTNTVVFASSATRNNIASTESLSTIMGKIAKWFSDLKAAAFQNVANNDTTTDDGYVADARIVKTHGDEIDAVKASVSTLSSKVSSFQTGVDALYNKCVSLGVTPSAKTLDAVTNALQNLYNTGYSKGNSAGYNTGYNAGVVAADSRVDSSSASYKSGYNAGVSAADARVNTSSASYTSGYSAGKAAATVKLSYYPEYISWYMSDEASKMNLSVTKSGDTWVVTPTSYLGRSGSTSDWVRNTGASGSMTTITLS